MLTDGPPPGDARLAVICIHGRGASAEDILGLAHELRLSDVAWLAPQAAGNTWYPYSFLSPLPQNEPGLTSALATIARLLAHLEEQGVPPERVGLLGFSQGACLSLEFAAGEGPVIANAVRTADDVAALQPVRPDDLGFVLESIRAARSALDGHVPLIGFAGAPFTLASSVSYTHLTLRRIERCRSRWSPYH